MTSKVTQEFLLMTSKQMTSLLFWHLHIQYVMIQVTPFQRYWANYKITVMITKSNNLHKDMLKCIEKLWSMLTLKAGSLSGFKWQRMKTSVYLASLALFWVVLGWQPNTLTTIVSYLLIHRGETGFYDLLLSDILSTAKSLVELTLKLFRLCPEHCGVYKLPFSLKEWREHLAATCHYWHYNLLWSENKSSPFNNLDLGFLHLALYFKQSLFIPS